jgi:uncharacterized pyridoxamine 5'-phosphate oxidase family protein
MEPEVNPIRLRIYIRIILLFFFKRIKVNQIIDLFPMLKELYDKGSQDAFFVVKFGVRFSIVSFLIG